MAMMPKILDLADYFILVLLVTIYWHYIFQNLKF